VAGGSSFYLADRRFIELIIFITYSDPPSWKQLINDSLSMNERISLMMSIFSDHDEVEVVGRLSGEHAQTFVDLIAEVGTFTLSPLGAGWLIITQAASSCPPGPRLADPQEVSALDVQDLWSSSPASEITEDSTLL
jgi:hypothetical protein